MTADCPEATRDLYWELTTSCQLACRYCFYETGLSPRVPRRPDAAAARKLIMGELCELFRSVCFTGGEVLLSPVFWDFVAMVRDAGICVSFLSDGLRLDAEALRRLRNSGVSRVAISLDSLSPEVNDAVRLPVARAVARGGTTIVANLRALARERPPGLEITVLQTIHRGNIDAIRPMIQFCRELDVGLLVHPAGLPLTTSVNDLRLETCAEATLRDLEAAMLEWAAGRPGCVGYTHAALTFIRGGSPSGLSCPMGTTSFFLDAGGDLYPCFHRRDLKLGNVWSEPLRQIVARGPGLGLASAPCANLACSCLLDCTECVPPDTRAMRPR